jgi:flagellar biosynthesis component FlhA
MAFGILIIATVAGYLAGGMALVMGAGIWMSLGVLTGTGLAVVLGLGPVVALRYWRASQAAEGASCPVRASVRLSRRAEVS